MLTDERCVHNDQKIVTSLQSEYTVQMHGFWIWQFRFVPQMGSVCSGLGQCTYLTLSFCLVPSNYFLRYSNLTKQFYFNFYFILFNVTFTHFWGFGNTISLISRDSFINQNMKKYWVFKKLAVFICQP